MANKKISELSPRTPTLTDVLPYSGGASSYKSTFSEVKSLIVASDTCRVGFFDYNDTATQTTPISVPGTNTYVPLTNNGLGAFTSTAYAPVGISSIWDTTNNRFTWSGLKLGDSIDIRLDLDVTTSSVNTQISVDLVLAEGTPDEYSIPFVASELYKSTGTYKITAFNGIYMGNAATLSGYAKFKIKSDAACTCKVNGWYARLLIRG